MENLSQLNRNEKVFNLENKTDPNHNLWRSVLNQTLLDAFGYKKLSICDYEKKQAEEFVQSRTSDFELLCELAGLDGDFVWGKISKFKEKISKEKDNVWKSNLL
jgi:hypothetical protein